MKSLKQRWDEIDRAEGSLDEQKWKLAADLAKANDEGKSTRDLAAEVARNKSTVSRWIQVHRQFGAARRNRTFSRAYDEVQGRTAESENARKDASAAKSAMRDPVQRKAVIEKIAKDDPDAVAEIAKDAIGATADDDVATDLATTAFDRSHEIRHEGRKLKPKAKRTGAFEGWLKVSSRIDAARYQAKLALKEIQGIDTPIPDDLRENLSAKLDRLDQAWELVRGIVDGESVGDQAEEFLAQLAAEDE